MLIEEKVFRRKRPLMERVLQYGFRKTVDGFCYETAFLDGEFRAFVFKEHEGNHDTYRRGGDIEQVPRHTEINEITARRILKKWGIKP